MLFTHKLTTPKVVHKRIQHLSFCLSIKKSLHDKKAHLIAHLIHLPIELHPFFVNLIVVCVIAFG
jgi:hypothetical protein